MKEHAKALNLNALRFGEKVQELLWSIANKNNDLEILFTTYKNRNNPVFCLQK